MRYAVAFTVENGAPVSRPMWATQIRTGSWKVTDLPEAVQTFAKRETAEKWAEAMSFKMPDRVVYGFEAVPAPATDTFTRSTP